MARKILIIDDETDIRTVLGMRLKDQGFEVLTASDGQDALSKLKKDTPDLIILDILMPVMNGFDFYKTIKKDPALIDIPVLIFTARGAMKDTFDAMDVDYFAEKTCDYAVIVEKVKFLLQKKVLLLSKDPDVIDHVKYAMEKKKYSVYLVETARDLADKGKKAKYEIIIAHLPFLDMPPEDFVKETGTFKGPAPKIIVFCDEKVEGTGDKDMVSIDDIRIKWRSAGVNYFYDPRATEKTFAETVNNWFI